MNTRTYAVTLKGLTPLLMHWDNLDWADVMKKWAMDPANKKTSVAGDDRSPAWRWIGSLYTDQGKVCLPSDNLMTMLREGGKKCPTGKGQQTFKAQTQSGMLVNEVGWTVVGAKGEIKTERIQALTKEEDFEVHQMEVADLGFSLFAKRSKVGQAKHVRVRPRFDVWSASGTITVMDDMITEDVLKNILAFAGTYSGIGDWRPSSPKAPGSFGKFESHVSKI